MNAGTDSRLQILAHNLLRIGAGLAYWSHGVQKLFGWFGGFGPEGGHAPLLTRFGAAAIIETTAGTLITLGLGTRWAVFIASGEMAVAYFWMHVPHGGLWWFHNHGELALLYAIIFFAIFARGPGTLSVDHWWSRRRTTTA